MYCYKPTDYDTDQCPMPTLIALTELKMKMVIGNKGCDPWLPDLLKNEDVVRLWTRCALGCTGDHLFSGSPPPNIHNTNMPYCEDTPMPTDSDADTPNELTTMRY